MLERGVRTSHQGRESPRWGTGPGSEKGGKWPLLEPSERTQPCLHLDVSTVSAFQPSELQNERGIKLCCFTPLSLWSFVPVATGNSYNVPEYVLEVGHPQLTEFGMGRAGWREASLQSCVGAVSVSVPLPTLTPIDPRGQVAPTPKNLA